MSEEEFQGTLERGDGPDRPRTAERKAMKKPDKACQPDKTRAERVILGSLECQPTSSRVKVEDLVTDEVEERRQSAASTAKTNDSVRSFWDQPVPLPDMQWAYDPHMPPEWNEGVASMVAQRWAGSGRPTGEVYRQPFTDEISEPSDEEDIPWLRQQWQQEFTDIVNRTKPKLPPWREVNHEINLIDETKQYKYHLPRCLRALQEQLRDKTNCYINAKWWEPWPVMQAAPLLCIPKKDGTLQTALDA
ncbi:hypothetical protein C0992_001658 [Termitomyces sp. T32_za158]|nr:hypothetical protein C0992_001658 [Termitomyces sp. T32_za158]